MLFIDRQIVGNEWRRGVVETVNRQAGAADDFPSPSHLRRRQHIVGDGDIKIEAFGVACDVGKVPGLSFHIKTVFGVRKSLSRKMHYAIRALEKVLQRMHFAKINSISRTETFSRLLCIEQR